MATPFVTAPVSVRVSTGLVPVEVNRPGSLALEFLSAYDAKLNEMSRHAPSYKCKIIASCRYVFSVLYNKLVILYRGSPGGLAVKESACKAGAKGNSFHP